MDTGVSVVGSGQVTAAPDVLHVSFSVEQVAPDVANAVARVGERTDAVLAALRDQGVAASQLGTSSVNVFQEYREPGTDTAYRASHTITVETKDLTGFGRLLNAAVDAAGNSLGLHGLEFDVEDKTELLSRARALAFQQARLKATELAGLAGYSLGAVRSISETHGFTPIREGVSYAASKAFDAAVNIVPGGQDIQVTLEVHFAWA